jgi:GGDEF domain-containing protein/PAS domain-containing protein
MVLSTTALQYREGNPDEFGKGIVTTQDTPVDINDRHPDRRMVEGKVKKREANHKEHERQLAEKAAQLELAMEALRGGFWHMDVNTETFQTSDRLAAFIGGPEAARLDLQRYLGKMNPEDIAAADLTPLLSGTVDQSVAEYRLDTVSGEKWMRCDRRLLRDADGRPRRVVGVAIDFTEEHRRLEASQRNSERDSLTGLLNRRGLANRYQQMSTTSGIGVLAVDLDGFKQVNDRFGHPAGDAVLLETARRLETCIRAEDLAARIGGDEFIVIVAGDQQAAEGVAERIVAGVRVILDTAGAGGLSWAGIVLLAGAAGSALCMKR